MLAVALPAVAALAGAVRMIDLGYHLRAGEAMIGASTILRVDVFSFITAGDPWLNQQWGAQVILATAHRALGLEGLQLLRAIVLAASLTFVFLACRARGASLRGAAILTLIGGLFLLPAFAIRPQMFGILLLSISLWALHTRARAPGRAWLLPVIAVIWANSHGSFVLLPAVIVLTAVEDAARGRRLRPLLVPAVIAVAATIVNPWGLGVWTYAIDILTNPLIRDVVTEWAPPTANTFVGGLFFASLMTVVLIVGRQGSGTRWTELLWLGAFALPAMLSIRAVAWWGVAIPPLIAGMPGYRARARAPEGVAIVNATVPLALVIAAVVLSPWSRPLSLKQAPRELPGLVVEVTDPGARLFVPQTWASWFELSAPDRPVFVDSRIELYPEGAWRDYFAVREGRADWASILDRWEVDALIAQPGWAVVRFIDADPGWKVARKTPSAVVFVRR